MIYSKTLLDTIQELNMDEDKRNSFLDKHYKRMGIIDEFDEHYPYLRKFGVLILVNIPKIGASDFLFVASEFEKLTEKYKDATHLRFSSEMDDLINRQSAVLYNFLMSSGCCDKIDETIINPKTNSMFLIGCNYNHNLG